MRDRLIELLKETFEYTRGVCIDFDEAAEINADHLLANGVIVPPCKVGDTVWFELHGQIEAAVVYHCTYESTHRGLYLSGAYAKDTRGIELSFNQNSLGKGVFLTREEAEQELKGENRAEIH